MSGLPRGSRTWAWSIIFATVALTAALAAMRHVRSFAFVPADSGPTDTLVASIRAEPRSFNRYMARDLTTTVLTFLMHGALVRINRVTNELEPELAARWELLPDQRTYRLRLRPNVRFSDGAPFSADDVVFSFRAIYDRAVGSILADTLQVRGQPLTVTAEDAATVVIRFPSPFAPGLRMLDGVPIYPRHRLEPALAAGKFRAAWGPSAPPSDIAGLGPFTLRRYEPGQRLTFDRNPYYWQSGNQRPHLAHLVLEVVTDQAAELLQLETGSIDLTQSELRPSDVPALKRAVAAGRVAVTDAGIGLDGDLFWLNLTSAKAKDPRSRWLQNSVFRRAIAQSIDRRAFVDTVYLGEAVPADSIVSPGNRVWQTSARPPEYDVAGARRLLGSLGLSERNGDAMLKDADGHPVRFSLLTQKGNTSLERGASVIRDSLAQIGVQVDVVALDVGALVDYVMRGNYDAAYFRLLTTDTDPALNLDFWLSSGSAHMWNPEQRAPSTAWEAEIDALMEQVATESNIERRRELFVDVQRIMAREVPVLCFAFPRLPIAVNSRVVDGMPAPFRPPLLWNPAVIGVRGMR
jgi:peptide/nickel transport system substrate-binding protein